jgi:cobalt/nickel transport system ATP-binding protein
MSLIVEVRNLTYSYEDGTQALKGIDFAMEEGTTVALLGRNGSGKTTFVHHLNGILRAAAGFIIIDGLPVTEKNLRDIRRRVGLVFQDSDNQLFMPSVLEDVSFGPLAAGVPQEEAVERARAALDRVGLAKKGAKAPWHLSAGEKKRAAIAGILATNAKLLVLDEPTTFLDPPGQRDLATLLAGLPQAKILVSHDVGFVRTLTDDAAFFEDGRIAARGSISELVRRFDW